MPTGIWPSANYGDAPKYASGVRGKVFVTPRGQGHPPRPCRETGASCARPEEAAKRELWIAHNDLKTTRPVVLADPENGWNELVTADSLRARGSSRDGGKWL